MQGNTPGNRPHARVFAGNADVFLAWIVANIFIFYANNYQFKLDWYNFLRDAYSF